MRTFFVSRAWLYFQVFFYAFAGLYHFLNPDFYIKIMPAWFPEKYLLNVLSGLAEVVLAIGVLFASTRKWAIYGLILLLMSFFAVHIGHLFEPPVLDLGNLKIDFTQKPIYYGLYLRLLLHCFLIWWLWQLARAKF